MATIPLWAIGKHITTCTLTPQTVNTTSGALSDGTPGIAFYGNLQDVEVESSFTTENISSMDRPFENNVPIESATMLRLTELEKSAGSNLAASAGYGASYFKFTLTRGPQTFTGYGLIKSYKMVGTKPRVTGQLELVAIDIGSSNPTYV